MSPNLLLALSAALALGAAGCAVESPAQAAEGSDDLVSPLPILDPLRAPMETDLKVKIVFKVQHLKNTSGWAFFLGQPLQASGKAVDYSKTKYQPFLDAGAFENTVAALMKQSAGKWTLVTYTFGSTDAAWPTWAAKYKAPAEIFKLAPAVASPAAGSAERKAVLDALRVPVAAELKTAVLFQVDRLKTLDGWAFLGGKPLKADGTAIDYHGTAYQVAIDNGAFDGTIFALLHQVGGKWTVVTYKIGATDVPYTGWAAKYKAPAAIFP